MATPRLAGPASGARLLPGPGAWRHRWARSTRPAAVASPGGSLLCAVLQRSGRTTIGVENPGHAVIGRSSADRVEAVADSRRRRGHRRPRPRPLRSRGRARDAGAPVPTGSSSRPGAARPCSSGRNGETRLSWSDYDAEFRYTARRSARSRASLPSGLPTSALRKTLAPTLRQGRRSRPRGLLRAAVHGHRAPSARAARLRGLPRARRARPAPAADARPPVPAPSRRARARP